MSESEVDSVTIIEKSVEESLTPENIAHSTDVIARAIEGTEMHFGFILSRLEAVIVIEAGESYVKYTMSLNEMLAMLQAAAAQTEKVMDDMRAMRDSGEVSWDHLKERADGDGNGTD